MGDFGFTSEDLPKETCWILKLLSLLKKQDGLQTFMLFKKGKKDVELVQIHFYGQRELIFFKHMVMLCTVTHCGKSQRTMTSF